MESWQAELVLDAHAGLAEGPLWDARTSELLWVDIMAGLVHRFDLAAGTDVALDVGQTVGAVVPARPAVTPSPSATASRLQRST
jgi:sugar lactone lactonase YvrE